MVHRIFLVEDHPTLRHAHLQVIQRTPGLECCGEAGSAEEALEKIPISVPDLVLVDLALPGMSGLELIQHLEHEHSTLSLLIVSGHEMETYVGGGTDISALGSNVKGYVMKHHGPVVLLDAIRQALGGNVEM